MVGIGELVPLRGDATELVEHEPGQRLVLPLGHLEAGGVDHLVRVQGAGHQPRPDAAGHLGQSWLPRVVLVVDLADDLLDHVLQSDDAGGAAVLVDHHRQVIAAVAHVGQERLQGPGLGHGHDLAHEVPHRGGGALVGRQGVHRLDQHHPDDVIEVSPVHREPGEAGDSGQVDQIRHVIVHRQRRHRHPRHQRIGRRLVGKAHRPGEQGGSGVADRALLHRRLQQPGQFGQGAHRLQLLAGLDAQATNGPVGGRVEQADDGTEHRGVELKERG